MSQKYFKEFDFNNEQIRKYLESASKDIAIAQNSKEPEVRFQFSYNALIKCAYALIGFKENKRARSQPGHHIKLLEAMAELLNDKNVFINGNAMRSKRNKDLYFAESIVTVTEADEYLEFVISTLERIKQEITFT